MNNLSVLKHFIDKQLARLEGLTAHLDRNLPVQIKLSKDSARPVVKISQAGYTSVELDFLVNMRDELVPEFSGDDFDPIYVGQVKETLEALDFSVQVVE
jgi:hypothetical protein